jgi:hypothetical protein
MSSKAKQSWDSAHPAIKTLTKVGAAAASVSAILVVWGQLSLPAPIMGSQAQFRSIEASAEESVQQLAYIQGKHYLDREEQLSRWIRETQSEIFDLRQRQAVEGISAEESHALQEQIIRLEEDVEAYKDERRAIREKKAEQDG